MPARYDGVCSIRKSGNIPACDRYIPAARTLMGIALSNNQGRDFFVWHRQFAGGVQIRVQKTTNNDHIIYIHVPYTPGLCTEETPGIYLGFTQLPEATEPSVYKLNVLTDTFQLVTMAQPIESLITVDGSLTHNYMSKVLEKYGADAFNVDTYSRQFPDMKSVFMATTDGSFYNTAGPNLSVSVPLPKQGCDYVECRYTNHIYDHGRIEILGLNNRVINDYSTFLDPTTIGAYYRPTKLDGGDLYRIDYTDQGKHSSLITLRLYKVGISSCGTIVYPLDGDGFPTDGHVADFTFDVSSYTSLEGFGTLTVDPTETSNISLITDGPAQNIAWGGTLNSVLSGAFILKQAGFIPDASPYYDATKTAQKNYRGTIFRVLEIGLNFTTDTITFNEVSSGVALIGEKFEPNPDGQGGYESAIFGGVEHVNKSATHHRYGNKTICDDGSITGDHNQDTLYTVTRTAITNNQLQNLDYPISVGYFNDIINIFSIAVNFHSVSFETGGASISGSFSGNYTNGNPVGDNIPNDCETYNSTATETKASIKNIYMGRPVSITYKDSFDNNIYSLYLFNPSDYKITRTQSTSETYNWTWPGGVISHNGTTTVSYSETMDAGTQYNMPNLLTADPNNRIYAFSTIFTTMTINVSGTISVNRGDDPVFFDFPRTDSLDAFVRTEVFRQGASVYSSQSPTDHVQKDELIADGTGYRHPVTRFPYFAEWSDYDSSTDKLTFNADINGSDDCPYPPGGCCTYIQNTTYTAVNAAGEGSLSWTSNINEYSFPVNLWTFFDQKWHLFTNLQNYIDISRFDEYISLGTLDHEWVCDCKLSTDVGYIFNYYIDSTNPDVSTRFIDDPLGYQCSKVHSSKGEDVLFLWNGNANNDESVIIINGRPYPVSTNADLLALGIDPAKITQPRDSVFGF